MPCMISSAWRKRLAGSWGCSRTAVPPPPLLHREPLLALLHAPRRVLPRRPRLALPDHLWRLPSQVGVLVLRLCLLRRLRRPLQALLPLLAVVPLLSLLAAAETAAAAVVMVTEDPPKYYRKTEYNL